jgi:hypothetical protein
MEMYGLTNPLAQIFFLNSFYIFISAIYFYLNDM